MAHYLAIARTDLDYGTDEIHVYMNKRHGITLVDTIYIEGEIHMDFKQVIAEVYREVPKALGSDIAVDFIYKR